MTTRTRLIKAPSTTVWDVLCDCWLYPLWVVGASRMREVDDNWPEGGSKLHHSVGTWPMLIDDNTEVLAVEPGTMLELKARAWPTGAATVVIELVPQGNGTLVKISEDATSGPAVLVPGPVRALGLQWRNNEALRRLAYICENRPANQNKA